MRRGTRFVSDSLNFTGIDLGDRSSGIYRRWQRGELDTESDDNDLSDSVGRNSEDGGDDHHSDDLGLSRLSPEHREEVLLHSALERISQAQAMGNPNVHLNKQELQAYVRHQQRMEEEERARRKKKRHSDNGSGERNRSRGQRIAVPLTQLAPTSRKKKASSPQPTDHHPPRQDSMGRQRAANDVPLDGRDRHGYPPMGYFPPPSAPRSRPRAGTTTSQRPPGHARDEHNLASRAVSANWPHPSARASPRDESSGRSSRPPVDPFQFQTAGPRAPYLAGAAATPRRHVSGPPETMYEQHWGQMNPAAVNHGYSLGQTSYGGETSETGSPLSEDGSSGSGSGSGSSDDGGNGVQIRPTATNKPRGLGRGRERGSSDTIVVEESKSKKKSSSPVKRKQVGGKKRRK